MYKILRNTILMGVVASAVFAAAPQVAFAEYPDRPVKFTSGFPPGDIEDLLTRVIVDEFTKETGVPAAMINKPGGGASVAAVGLLEQPADGANIGAFPISVPIIHPLRGHEVLKKGDFEPVVAFLTFPIVVVTKADSPYNNFKELQAVSQTTPVKLGHFGDGVLPTMVTRMILKKNGTKVAGEAAFDEVNCGTVLNGDADIAIATVQTVLPCLTSGEVKAIGSMTEKRLPISPNAATFSEQYPEIPAITSWFGLYVKKGTPQAVKDKITAIAKVALESEQAKKLAQQANTELFFISGKDAEARVEEYFPRIEALLKDGAK